jgi:hypothetical protein
MFPLSPIAPWTRKISDGLEVVASCSFSARGTGSTNRLTSEIVKGLDVNPSLTMNDEPRMSTPNTIAGFADPITDRIAAVLGIIASNVAEKI